MGFIRVKISSINVTLETIVPRKEETFQVVIDIIKNSKRFKAFTISADVPEIFMQQFSYTIKKVQGTYSYDFLLANKKCVVNVYVFRTILDICPRVEGVNFTAEPNDDATLAFLIELRYKGPLYKHTSMFVDHMHPPWRTLAAIINKCLSGKTTSNDKLRKSRIDILCGMFYRESVGYPELIWEDLAFQIDHRKEKRSRHKNMPFPRFTKIIINHFLSQHKSLSNLKYQHYYTIKDDSIVSRLKFIRSSEDYQEYGLFIPKTMLTKAIKQLESYLMFIKYSTGQIYPKTSRDPEPPKRKTTSRRVVKKKVIIPPKKSRRCFGVRLKGVPSLTPEKQEADDTVQALKESRKTKRRQPDQLDHKENDDKDGDVGNEGDDNISDTQDDDDEDAETESDEDEIYKYKIHVRKDVDAEMTDPETAKLKEPIEFPLPSSNMSFSSGFGTSFFSLSDISLTGELKDIIKADFSSLMDIHIQQETPQIQSLSVQMVPISVIPETTNLPPIHEILTKTLVSIVVSSPHMLATISTVQQTSTPILTPSITTDAPTITTAFPESNAIFVVQIRVAKLEKDVLELKKIDLFAEALATLKTQVPSVIDNYLGSKVTNVFQNELKKHTENLIQKYSGKKTKRRRAKESESSKKSSTTKETPKGKAPSKGFKTGKYDSAKEPVEEPTTQVVMDDAGEDVVRDDDKPQYTSEPKTAKTPNLEWFTQPLRPPTLDPGWNKRQVILDQPEQPWFNQMISSIKDPLNSMTSWLLRLTSLRDRYPFDLSKRLPLQDHLDHLTLTADYYYNNDMEYLKSSDPERTYTTSITNKKAARYEIEGIKVMVPTIWSPTKVGYDKDALKGIKH
nr:hypothetical protein [Tanacetum cinerariifolium]